MAVYTELSTDELDGLLSAYDIGVLKAYAGITSGVENTNYLLHTAAGRSVLTLYEKRVDHQDLRFSLDLKEHLAGKDCAFPGRCQARMAVCCGTSGHVRGPFSPSWRAGKRTLSPLTNVQRLAGCSPDCTSSESVSNQLYEITGDASCQ